MLTQSTQGLEIPALFYGTAWKEERTAALTRAALDAGFRAIDTANQRKHYFEAAVGEAVAGFIAEGHARREDLFLQTKFTYDRGQDHRVPYDLSAPFGTQVRQSFASSLQHLHTRYLDSLVLHGPYGARGIDGADREVWQAFEALYNEGLVRLLGVSNVAREQLETLHREATVKPAFVQNRCYARDGWDREVRAFCRANGVLYQGFSLLTANQRELASAKAIAIARRLGRTMPEVVFRMAIDLGMVALTGTSNPDHMRRDLSIGDLELTHDDLATLERIAAR